MSIETKFSLGFHEFLRYAIPGYIYLFVFLLPVFLSNSKTISIELLLSVDPLLSSALLVIAGPILGYIIFYIYYPIFVRFFYNYKTTQPYKMIEKYASEKLKEKGVSHLPDNKMEILVRTLEDLALQTIYSEKTSERFDFLKNRIEFLFSSFHSLGTIVSAIWLGMISWLIGGFLNHILSNSPIIFTIKLFDVVYWYFFVMLWFIISIIVLKSWSYRKNFAIVEEFLLVSTFDQNRLHDLWDQAIEKYVSNFLH